MDIPHAMQDATLSMQSHIHAQLTNREILNRGCYGLLETPKHLRKYVTARGEEAVIYLS